jgi:hypothetical protein
MSTIAPELYSTKVKYVCCAQYNQYCVMNAYHYFLRTKRFFYFYSIVQQL